jgi:hypothetical protein
MVAALINTDDCLINSSIVDLIDRLYGPCHTDADAEVLLSHAAEWISSASPSLDPGCLFCNVEHTQIDNKHMLLNTIKKNELVHSIHLLFIVKIFRVWQSVVSLGVSSFGRGIPVI